MILDHALVAAGDEDEMFDAGLLASSTTYWMKPVDDGQHFLGHCLVAGRTRVPGQRKNGYGFSWEYQGLKRVDI
jgi:hypothetical protein